MWKNNPEPWEMRQMFPEEARLLEDAFLIHELRQLEIIFTRIKLKKSTTIRVSLNDSYELLLSPVDKGPEGQAEWFSWHMPHEHNQPNHVPSKVPAYHMSIRASIKLVRKSENGSDLVHSFTNAQSNLEDLLKSSLFFIKKDKGLNLTPICKSTKNRSFKRGA
jgi:hypothetical protein